MGLQLYRADSCGSKQINGGVPHYTKWIGGLTLALIRNCKVQNMDISPRTVYVRGEPDTFFSIPAACSHKRRTIKGYITTDDNGEYCFWAYKETK